MSFETWEDARPVRLEFGDGAKRRVVRSEGADYHESEEAHDWVAVSLMPLCRQDEYGVDGLLVRKGVHTDCVRPGNGQKVMLQLSPAANSRPIIICKLYPPPPTPPPSPPSPPSPPPAAGVEVNKGDGNKEQTATLPTPAAPSVPPPPDECELNAHYKVTASWNGGEAIEVSAATLNTELARSCAQHIFCMISHDTTVHAR